MVMIKKFRSLCSLFVLMAVMMPSIIKLEHHHVHNFNIRQGEECLTKYQVQCAVCSFEYSLFVSGHISTLPAKTQLVESGQTFFLTGQFATHPFYSFFLRAPPDLTILNSVS